MIAGGSWLLVLAMITSAIAAAFARRRGIVHLGAAAVVAVETIGAAVLFFVANVTVGIGLVLAARQLTPFYLTIYAVSDLALLIISLLQALVFETWRRSLGGGLRRLRPPSDGRKSASR